MTYAAAWKAGPAADYLPEGIGAFMPAGPVSRGLFQEAREEGIEVWDGQIFRNRFRDLRLTEADWQAASSARAGNLRIAQEQLARL